MDHRVEGAFTGEVSPTMLTDLGVNYVIIGHSERRQLFGETNTGVNLKVKAALSHGLIPILCVGETLDERESRLTDSVVRRQVGAALADISIESAESLIVAYEPVWAIGTGKVCEAKEANRVCKLIRSTASDLYQSKNKLEGHSIEQQSSLLPILYGGSVKPDNIDELMAQEDVDGALVGGASLNALDFVSLIESARKRVRLLLSRV
jgi:triosephosphate isomerase